MILIAVVGLVVHARCHPFDEEKVMEATPPGCTEDPQVCQGFINYLDTIDVTGSWRNGSRSWFLQMCLSSGLRHSGAWSSMMTDPSRTWGGLCPATCKMCPDAIPEPCSDNHPVCSEIAQAVRRDDNLCDADDGFYHKLCPKTCGSCRCSDRHPGCAEFATLAAASGYTEYFCDYWSAFGMDQTCPQTCGAYAE